jgi:hypothetical protein
MTTLAIANKALKEKFGDIELVRGDGYYYFFGNVASNMQESGLYGGWNLRTTTVQELIDEVEHRLKENGRGGIY